MNKRSFIALAIIAMLVVLAGCGARRSQAYYDYNSKIIASELDGAYTIRAFGRARNAVDAYEKAQKQAVRDVILLGVESSDATVKPLKALLLEVNAEQKYEDYLNAFFAEGGPWQNYCNLRQRRILSSNFARTDAQVVAQVSVTVFRNELKARLIADGILKQ